MAVAARQRREEKVCSTKKPSQDEKIMQQTFSILGLKVEFEKVQIGSTFINFPFTPYPLQVGLNSNEHCKVTC